MTLVALTGCIRKATNYKRRHIVSLVLTGETYFFADCFDTAFLTKMTPQRLYENINI